MYLNETMAEKQELQNCACCHLFRTSVQKFRHYLRMNATLTSLIILLIIHWFLYIGIFILFTFTLMQHTLTAIHASHFYKQLLLYYAIKPTELMTDEVVSFEKLFHWTKFLAFESQKFLSLKCCMKA